MSRILKSNKGSVKTNSSRKQLQALNSAIEAARKRTGKSKLNAAVSEELDNPIEEPVVDTATPDDKDFVDEVSDIITDENGNEFTVDELVVVQDKDTNEISLFIPDDADESIPDNVKVIGEVVGSNDGIILDSNRKLLDVKSRRLQASKAKETKKQERLNSSSPLDATLDNVKQYLTSKSMVNEGSFEYTTQNGLNSLLFYLTDDENIYCYIITPTPDSNEFDVFEGKAMEATDARDKAASSYPVHCKSVYDFIRNVLRVPEDYEFMVR